MLFFRSYFFKGSETDLNKLVQKQLALNSIRVTLESFQPNNNNHRNLNHPQNMYEYNL